MPILFKLAGRHGPFRTLVLVRHGEVAPDLGLTSFGRSQAARAGKRLRGLPVTKIHCSTMRRAHETAQIVAKHHPGRTLVRTHLLRECLPTAPRGIRCSAEMRERIRKGRDQADRAYHRYFKPPANGRECEILVSHGNVIRYLVGRALGMSERSWYGLGTSLCGITVVRVLKTGACVLERYNDTGHLTPDLV